MMVVSKEVREKIYSIPYNVVSNECFEMMSLEQEGTVLKDDVVKRDYICNRCVECTHVVMVWRYKDVQIARRITYADKAPKWVIPYSALARADSHTRDRLEVLSLLLGVESFPRDIYNNPCELILGYSDGKIMWKRN